MIDSILGWLGLFKKLYPVTYATILLCVILWPFRAIWPLQSSYVTDAVTKHYWNIPLADLSFVTYMFQHELRVFDPVTQQVSLTFAHIGVNLFVLFLLAPLLEAAIGHGRMLVFILVTGVGAGLVHYFADPFLVTPAIGLSGVVVGLLVLLAFAAPRVLLGQIPCTGIPVRVYHLALLVFALQLKGFIERDELLASGLRDHSAYWIHIGGALTGFALWLFWLRTVIDKFKESDEGKRLFR